jgi:hypothetical protein
VALPPLRESVTMKTYLLAFAAVALAAPAVAVAGPSGLAPAVARPVPANAVPAAPEAPAAAAATPAPVRTTQIGAPQTYAGALAAVPPPAGARDSTLDASLVNVMSRLLAAASCDDAAGLASRNGRDDLAARARQLCQRN